MNKLLIRITFMLTTIGITNISLANGDYNEDINVHAANCGDQQPCWRTHIPTSIPGAFSVDITKIGDLQKLFPEGTPLDTADKMTFNAMMLAYQIYFKTTEEGYVASFPGVIENADQHLQTAISSGFMTVHAPLDEYRQYQTDAIQNALKSSKTLVIGCGNLCLQSPGGFQVNYGIVPSSGFACNHDQHVTVSIGAAWLPTIVADATNPRFLNSLPQGFYDKIIFEEGHFVTQDLLTKYIQTLSPTGKIIKRNGAYKFYNALQDFLDHDSKEMLDQVKSILWTTDDQIANGHIPGEENQNWARADARNRVAGIFSKMIEDKKDIPGADGDWARTHAANQVAFIKKIINWVE